MYKMTYAPRKACLRMMHLDRHVWEKKSLKKRVWGIKLTYVPRNRVSGWCTMKSEFWRRNWPFFVSNYGEKVIYHESTIVQMKSVLLQRCSSVLCIKLTYVPWKACFGVTQLDKRVWAKRHIEKGFWERKCALKNTFGERNLPFVILIYGKKNYV